MWQRLFGTCAEQVKDLVARLTPSQKLVAGILGATIVVGLLVVALFTGGGSYVALARHQNPTELQAMAGRLRDAGYHVRVNEGMLQVKENELPRALSYVASEVASSPRRDGWAWLDEDPSWGETSLRQQEKARRAKTINLEESIKVCPDIIDAIVELNVKNSPFTVLDTGEAQNSASVTVTLGPGVGRLKPAQVRVIRNVVSGGASVPYRNVSVTDNRLNSYAVEEEESGDVAGFDERRQAEINDYRKRISGYLEQTFRRGEYSLFVDVCLRRERVETDSETIEPSKKPVLISEETEKEKGRREAGGGSPGVAANVGARLLSPGESPKGEPEDRELRTVDYEERDRSKREYAPLVSRTRDRRTSPAGSIEKISVAVRLDKQALERVASKLRGIALGGDNPKARMEIEGAVSDYVQASENEIKTMLQLHGPVTVTVRPDVLLATAEEAGAAVIRAGGVWQWAQENALLLVLGALGFAALGFVYSLARRAIPPPIEIPPVEFPEEALAVAEAAPAAGAAAAGGGELETLNIEDEDFTNSLAQAETVVREKPTVAAAVVKMWMGAGAPAGAEKR